MAYISLKQLYKLKPCKDDASKANRKNTVENEKIKETEIEDRIK